MKKANVSIREIFFMWLHEALTWYTQAVVKVFCASFPLSSWLDFVFLWPPVYLFPKQNHCVKLCLTTMPLWNITISLNCSVGMHLWFKHCRYWTQLFRIWHSRLITVFICNDVNITTDEYCCNVTVSEFFIILFTKTGLLSVNISVKKKMEMKIEYI